MFKTIDLSKLLDKFKFSAIQEWINNTVNWQQPLTLTDAATVNWNYRDGYNAKVTLAGNRTLNINGLKPGAYGTLEIIQGSGGSRTLTLPTQYTNKVANDGGGLLVLSTVEQQIDVAAFYYNGSYILWTLSTNFTS